MDIKVEKKPRPIFKNKALVSVVVLLVLLLIYRFGFVQEGESLSKDSLIIAPIAKGDLEISVDGYGQLRSKTQRLITSLTTATVSEVILKPGAIVKPDSVIAVLSNPELELEVRNARYQLVRLETNFKQKQLEQEKELLNEHVALDNLIAEHESVSKVLAAQFELNAKGIISSLSYEETKLRVDKLAREIDSKKSQIGQLERIFKITDEVNQQEISQQNELLELTEQRFQSLKVKAGFDGVLQRLSIEIGQNLSIGQEIALVGSDKDLIALIQVPQGKVQQVKLGMEAIIDTRMDEIKGEVARIDPIVEDNTVEVEIRLSGDMPQSARPELSVDGTIIVGKLKDVYYVRRPANAVTGQTKAIYRLNANSDQATLVDIEFGMTSGEFIEVRGGVNHNQSIIISDLPSYVENKAVLNIH
ncbi:efflux RND transporter periplasmic adaptor subunit [Pseudoalteromonas umbrosa]|uniref:efflux RND transporter periplasmic adaptor subunit n=1 Tax=Pseudoalteromonas umbrosa TaxID=3048489 RepID=UPI0024C37040|nr:HlyD family efflux transporter periplasmic adaptor subunit [Pseudoalteromonas sp. B95]MDK1288855.1 HlyD family efflux transporter periplasmic adaptor subunit [Pseudoalteromonas sp. B95]